MLNFQFVARILGVLYPLMMTVKVVASGDFKTERDEYRHWVTYWALYGALLVVDAVFESIETPAATLQLIPFYYTMQTVVLVWLSHRRGALLVFRSFVGPLMTHYSRALDKAYLFTQCVVELPSQSHIATFETPPGSKKLI